MDEKIKEKLARLRVSFMQRLPEKIEEIENAWIETEQISALPATEQLMRLAHNLRGTSASYGCSDVSVIAEKIEAEVSAFARGEGAKEPINRLIQELKSLARA